jgi:hypothetical protein
MLFNSQLFLLVFLPVALAVQWIVADRWRWWIASLLFMRVEKQREWCRINGRPEYRHDRRQDRRDRRAI